MFDSLRWRSIGPYRGGRVVAVHGDPARPLVFYFGACAGGVWKTDDAGITWSNVSDGQLGSAAIGALAVAPSDPNVIYAGTGEACIRGNVCAGDGVYRSTDGGRTWTNVGLPDSRHISRIRVDPRDPDLVYVGVLGHAFGPSAERGVYRSRDGGRTWSNVLHRDDISGCADLALDAGNPRILYAALWDAQRGPYFLRSGGPGSGLWKSVDGGDTWREITRANGLPRGVIGRMGIAPSPARPGRVWALIEAEDGGLYRSDDGGGTWQLLSDNPDLRARPFYYTHVFADPRDAETVYVLALGMWKSTDGGRGFRPVPTPHGDNHDLWIDPRDPERLIEGNDGGACVSLDGGRSWSTIYNQPTAQFYHVTTDTRFPYRVYGAQQDNTTLCVPSRSDEAGIPLNTYYDVGGAESGYIAVRPDDPDVVFAGSSGGGEGGRITRYDHRTRQRRDVSPWPQRTAGRAASSYTHRFQWTSPIVHSPHDPGVLYACGNRVFRTADDGVSWDLISPDLTRDDKSKQGPSGGPITLDHTGVEVYCTIFAFAESPVQRGLLWAGSDDGLIHVSRDAGATWENVTPPASLLPEWALISIIDPSPHRAGTAYVAATRYKWDDPRPYLLRTDDFGKTWQPIVNGIGASDFTRAVREDPARPGLLYCGTEAGVYVSYDAGGNWRRLGGNLPVVPVHDLVVKGDDLVLGTHGRGFWILDDLTPLRQWDRGGGEPVRLFAPKPAYRVEGVGGGRGGRIPAEVELAGPVISGLSRAGGNGYVRERPAPGQTAVYADAGQNPPHAVVVHYHLAEPPAGDVTLTFRDAAGQVIRTFSSSSGGGDGVGDPPLSGEPGLNRFAWDMRYPEARRLDPGAARPAFQGPPAPYAVPGTYTVELAAGGALQRQAFEIRKDPRVPASQADLQQQFDLLIRIRDEISAVNAAVLQCREVKAQVDEWAARGRVHARAGALTERAERLKAAITAIEGDLVHLQRDKQTRAWGFEPRLADELTHLFSVAASALAAPTKATYTLFEQLAATAEQRIAALRQILASDVAEFGALVRELDLPAVAATKQG